MRFVLVRQAGSVELQFMFVDQCLYSMFIQYVYSRLNTIWSSYKAIESLWKFVKMTGNGETLICIPKMNKSLMGLELEQYDND